MVSETQKYLKLTAHPSVGAVLLDARPTWIWNAEGSRILWSNAAGLAFFNTTKLSDLLERTFGDMHPARRHLARLAIRSRPDAPMIERLRFFHGQQAITSTCLCKRLVINNQNVMLVLATDRQEGEDSSSVQARALARAITGEHVTASAIIDADGDILGSFGDMKDLATSAEQINDLLENCESVNRYSSIQIENEIGEWKAGAVRIGEGEDQIFLLIIETPRPESDQKSGENSEHGRVTRLFAAHNVPLSGDGDKPDVGIKVVEQTSFSENDDDLMLEEHSVVTPFPGNRDQQSTSNLFQEPEETQADPEISRTEDNPPDSISDIENATTASTDDAVLVDDNTDIEDEVATSTDILSSTDNETISTSETDVSISPDVENEIAISSDIKTEQIEVSLDENQDSDLDINETTSADEPVLEDEQDLFDDDRLASPMGFVIHSGDVPKNTDETPGSDTNVETGQSTDISDQDAGIDQDDEVQSPPPILEISETGNETPLDELEATNIEQEDLPEPQTAVQTASVHQFPSTIEPAFKFSAKSIPDRFTWELDSDYNLTALSDALPEAIGPSVRDFIGKNWDVIAEQIGFDEDGRVRTALDKRDTWTGLKVFWPVDGEDLLVPVELTGLPIIRHQSGFEGYRGFGICFTGSAVKSERFEREQIHNPDAEAGNSDSIEQSGILGVVTKNNEVIPQETLQPDHDVSENAEQISTPDANANSPENSDQSIEPTELPVNGGFETPQELVSPDHNTTTADEINANVEKPASDSALNAPITEPFDADQNTPLAHQETERAVEATENSDDEVIVSPITDEILEAARTAVTAVRELVAQGTTGKTDKDGEPSLSRADEQPASDEENTSPETSEAGPVVTIPDQAESAGSEKMAPRLVSDQNAMESSNPDSIETKTIDAADNDEVDIATDINDNSDEDQSDAKHESKNIVVLDIPDTKAENSNVVILPKTPGAAAHTIVSLSTGEKAAFRQIAEALGANADGTKSKKTGLEHTGARNAKANENAARPKSIKAKDSNNRPDEPLKTTGNQNPGITGDQPDLDDVSVLSAFLDRIVTPLIVIQEDTIRFANRSSLEFLGYNSSEEFEAVGGFETLFPDQEASSGHKNVLDANGISVSVTANITTVMWEKESAILLSMTPLEKPASSKVVNLANETDISADMERIAELEAILDTATDGVIVLDSKGLVERMNHSAEALFEVERHDFAGQSFLDLFAEESHRSSVDYLESLTNNGVASVLNDGREVIGKTRASGGLIPLFITMGRLVQPGKTRFCMIVRDITQWKKAEEDLLTSKRKAEAASSQKSDFLARISHEIRTPLNAIIGFSEVMMEERFGSVGNERYKGYLSDIHLSGRHIMSLINDLLDLSKVEAGKLDLNFQAQNLTELIQDTVALMQPQANSEQIIIRTSLSDHVPSIVADERSLRQIVLNLLSNGIKYTRSGGQVIISTSYEDNGEVALRVRDTGVGMSEKQLEAALEPFRQLSTSSSTRMADGTGLGLPLTKALAEANRARFVISSKADKGTLVEITFPNSRVLANQDH